MRVPFANWRIALCSVANESLDTFSREAFHFCLGVAAFTGRTLAQAGICRHTLFEISPLGKRISEVEDA
jgi:hypothetical protein